MGEFKRKLNLVPLQRLASAEGENWWKELLRLWQPSGTGAGGTGLRLAIRDNYLNFYRRGQSVARVAFDQNGDPYASVHWKYLRVEADRYACLKDGFFTDPKEEFRKPFVPVESFLSIIEVTREWAGREKFFVDQAVAQNESVIDLEIGLPRIPDEEGGAPRMDLALLERGERENQVNLVFWEAKTIDDSRLRATDPEKAKVHEQLDKYVRYMDDAERSSRATEEYREYCSLLVELAEMLPTDKAITLSPLIRIAARHDSDLSIEKKPRLVIFEGHTENKGKPCHVKRIKTWETYYQSLLSWKPKVFTDGDCYKLTE